MHESSSGETSTHVPALEDADTLYLDTVNDINQDIEWPLTDLFIKMEGAWTWENIQGILMMFFLMLLICDTLLKIVGQLTETQRVISKKGKDLEPKEDRFIELAEPYFKRWSSTNEATCVIHCEPAQPPSYFHLEENGRSWIAFQDCVQGEVSARIPLHSCKYRSTTINQCGSHNEPYFELTITEPHGRSLEKWSLEISDDHKEVPDDPSASKEKKRYKALLIVEK